FAEWIVDNLLVVALPEEFFYRGYIQGRLRDLWPEGKTIFGARLGRAFWLTALLFAIGHLAIFQTWRLAVIFPALLFGWLRERTGTVMGAALFHATCNLLALILEASFFGRHMG
ncbi:MAG TPA: MXAN_2755 family glutamic-type intramembrane protease, partial [Myxococcaceae bacterium]|nr:MXAN_2755 family glutamic-type intramembrane protease [Myxococcaceae bacterium]